MTGAPEVVLVRGQVIVENDELVAAAGRRPVREAREGRRGADAGAEGAGVSDEQARQVYEQAGLGQAVTLRLEPGRARRRLLAAASPIPACTLGADMTAEVEATKRLLDAAREKGLPVVFTTIGFEPSGKDGGLWLQKAPALADLELGGRWVEIDPRLDRREDETIVLKKGASGVLRDEPRVDPRLAGRRHRDPLRRDDERLRAGDGGRPAPVRLADARPARVRGRPRAGAARREPVRHPGEVRGRRAARRRRSPTSRACPGAWARPLEPSRRRPRRATASARRWSRRPGKAVDALGPRRRLGRAALGLGVLPRARADDAGGLARAALRLRGGPARRDRRSVRARPRLALGLDPRAAAAARPVGEPAALPAAAGDPGPARGPRAGRRRHPLRPREHRGRVRGRRRSRAPGLARRGGHRGVGLHAGGLRAGDPARVRVRGAAARAS